MAQIGTVDTVLRQFDLMSVNRFLPTSLKGLLSLALVAAIVYQVRPPAPAARNAAQRSARQDQAGQRSSPRCFRFVFRVFVPQVFSPSVCVSFFALRDLVMTAFRFVSFRFVSVRVSVWCGVLWCVVVRAIHPSVRSWSCCCW